MLPLLAGIYANSASAQVTDLVCMETTYGDICFRLFPEDAPKTVANFMQYVNDGDFNGTVIHRVEKGFVIQGGGYRFGDGTLNAIPKDAAITNEYKRPNVRGTIAMAKIGGDANSATSEWFINLGDNTTILGTANNSGFTVFGEVVLNGMSVVDCIVARPTFGYLEDGFGGYIFPSIPLRDVVPLTPLTASNFLTVGYVYATQRDLSDPNANSVCTTPVPRAVGRYEARSFMIPVRIGGKIYQLIFRQVGDPPVYAFTAESYSIVELKDVGQETAVFANNTLTIPSIIMGEEIFTDLVFTLTNHETLEFTLQSFNRKPQQ